MDNQSKDRTHDRVLNAKATLAKCGGKSKSWLYRVIENDGFPAGFHLGARSRVWWASDVASWLAGRELQVRAPTRAPEAQS